MSNEKADKRPLTLQEDDVTASAAPMSRRAAMTAVTTVAVGAGATQLAGCFVVPARGYRQPTATVVYQPAYQTGLTDSDGGTYADQAGYGRGGAHGYNTGITDADNGSGGIQDRAGQGRGHYQHQGWTSGVTDGDSGAYADPGGNGRGTGRRGNTGFTDSDGGTYADPAGGGRGRYR